MWVVEEQRKLRSGMHWVHVITFDDYDEAHNCMKAERKEPCLTDGGPLRVREFD